MARYLILPLLAIIAVLAVSWLVGEVLRQRRD
jgi:hypothetical protein